jgi:hypothetical protein
MDTGAKMADQQVVYGKNDWRAIILEHDKKHYEDDDAYEFSNGRKMKSTDRYETGIYKNS